MCHTNLSLKQLTPEEVVSLKELGNLSSNLKGSPIGTNWVLLQNKSGIYKSTLSDYVRKYRSNK